MIPPCQGTLWALPGSYTGSLNAGSRFSSTFGSRSWWSSASYPPRFIRVTTQSESVMRSHPVGWSAWNSGTSLAKNSWLSLMISRYVRSMSYLDWKASSVGRWPPFAGRERRFGSV